MARYRETKHYIINKHGVRLRKGQVDYFRRQVQSLNRALTQSRDRWKPPTDDTFLQHKPVHIPKNRSQALDQFKSIDQFYKQVQDNERLRLRNQYRRTDLKATDVSQRFMASLKSARKGLSDQHYIDDRIDIFRDNMIDAITSTFGYHPRGEDLTHLLNGLTNDELLEVSREMPADLIYFIYDGGKYTGDPSYQQDPYEYRYQVISDIVDRVLTRGN